MLSNVELAQHIRDAKAGDEASLAALIAYFMPAVRSQARAAVRPGLDFDDAVQEGLIGLFGAMESYDETNSAGASFATYAGACISNAVRSAQRTASRKKHAPLNQSVPLREEQAIPGPEDTTIENEQVQLMLERARTRLSSFEKEVLALYLDGHSYSGIAARLGKGQKSVDNALVRIRQKLR